MGIGDLINLETYVFAQPLQKILTTKTPGVMLIRKGGRVINRMKRLSLTGIYKPVIA